jgi:hypothetical protein
MQRLLIAATLLLAGCAGSPTAAPASASALPTASAASSPSPVSPAAIFGVASEVFPPSSAQSHPPGTDGYVECEFSTGVDFQFTVCPVTTRFLARLHQNPSASDQARPFCRCQNILPKRDITTESTVSGAIAHIDLGNAQIDLLMTIDGGRLLVDDTQCPGKGSATSYYLDPVAPCF